MRLFIDKAWGYGDPKPDHYFLALNYRMSELQGAVALAQLGKLEASVKQRIEMAARLTKALDGLPGIETPSVHPENRHVFWRYVLRVDVARIPGGPAALAAALKGYDVASAPRYIQKPAFRCEIFAKQRTFGSSRYPFTLARPEAVDYSSGAVPGHVRGARRDARAALERAVRAAACRLPGRGHRRRRLEPRGSARVNDSLAFGLIGAGGIAQSYLQVFSGLKAAHIAAVADVRLDAATSAAEALGCEAFGSWEELASRRARCGAHLHAAVLTRRNRQALPGASASPCCARSRSPSTSSDARELAAASVKNHTLLTMASKFRYVQDVIRAKSILDVRNPRRHHPVRERLRLAGKDVQPLELRSGGQRRRRAHRQRHALGRHHPIFPGTDRGGAGGRRKARADAGGRGHRADVRAGCQRRSGTIDLSWSLDKERDSYIEIYGSNGTVRVGWKESKFRQATSRDWVVFGSGYDKIAAMRGSGGELLSRVARRGTAPDHRRGRHRVGRGDRAGVPVARQLAMGARL